MSYTITSFTKSFTKIFTLSIEQGFFVSVNILLSSPDFKMGGWGGEGEGEAGSRVGEILWAMGIDWKKVKDNLKFFICESFEFLLHEN